MPRTTSAWMTSPGRKHLAISTLSISVSRTSLVLDTHVKWHLEIRGCKPSHQRPLQRGPQQGNTQASTIPTTPSSKQAQFPVHQVASKHFSHHNMQQASAFPTTRHSKQAHFPPQDIASENMWKVECEGNRKGSTRGGRQKFPSLDDSLKGFLQGFPIHGNDVHGGLSRVHLVDLT